MKTRADIPQGGRCQRQKCVIKRHNGTSQPGANKQGRVFSPWVEHSPPGHGMFRTPQHSGAGCAEHAKEEDSYASAVVQLHGAREYASTVMLEYGTSGVRYYGTTVQSPGKVASRKISFPQSFRRPVRRSTLRDGLDPTLFFLKNNGAIKRTPFRPVGDRKLQRLNRTPASTRHLVAHSRALPGFVRTEGF